MSPAFSSPKQAGAFALLLLFILLLPVLVGKSLLPPREENYSLFSFRDQIFEEKGDIDIAFMGSSRMGCAINPDYVQRKLSEKLGRKAVVRTLTWTWNGFDALYFISQDLLEHRKVHMIVFCDLNFIDGNNQAHHQASTWFRFADNVSGLAGLQLKSKISFYAAAVIGMPQNLIELLRSNMPASVDTSHWSDSPTNYEPRTNVTSSDASIYSESTKEQFLFSSTPIATMQQAFVRKIGALAQEHQTHLAYLHIPDFKDRKDTVVKEETFWPGVLGASLPMAGIPPAILFSGLTDEETFKLYYNPTHFNQNGRNYFTPIMTPALIQIYEDQIKP